MITILFLEYKKVVNEYQLLLKKITPSKFEYVFDSQTEDSDCKSIQTITKHIIRSGHTYANYLNQKSSLEWIEYEKVCISPEDGINQLNTMIQFSLNALFLVDEFSIEKIENLNFIPDGMSPMILDS